jgi:hypothetical protein
MQNDAARRRSTGPGDMRTEWQKTPFASRFTLSDAEIGRHDSIPSHRYNHAAAGRGPFARNKRSADRIRTARTC